MHWGGRGIREISRSIPRLDKIPRGACHRRYEHGTVPRRGEYVKIASFLCRVITVQSEYILRPVGGAFTPMVVTLFACMAKGVIGQLGHWVHVQNVSGFYNNELIVIAGKGLNWQLYVPSLWWPPKKRVIQLRTKSPRA